MVFLRLGNGKPKPPKKKPKVEIHGNVLHVYCKNQESAAEKIREIDGVDGVTVYGSRVEYVRVVCGDEVSIGGVVEAIERLRL